MPAAERVRRGIDVNSIESYNAAYRERLDSNETVFPTNVIDKYRNVPNFFVVHDSRHEDDPEEASYEVEMMDYLDSVCDSIEKKKIEDGELDSNYRVDNTLRMWIKYTALLTHRKNRECGLRPYTRAELMILAWEFWYVDHLQGHRVRGDGSSYSRDHLFNSVINGICLAGVTELAFLIALLHHDDYEDSKYFGDIHLPRPNPNFLLARRFYKDDIKPEDIPPEYAKSTGSVVGRYCRELNDDVNRLVSGVTNAKAVDETLKHLSKQETNAIDFRKFLANIKDFKLLVALVRLAERRHNTSTLDGMPENKRLLKADESTALHAPVARVLELMELHHAIVDDCFEAYGPGREAKKRFEEGRELRMKQHMVPLGSQTHFKKDLDKMFRDSILKERLVELQKSDPSIVYIAIKPKPFTILPDAALQKFNEPGYNPMDDVDSLDSLFEVIIMADTPENAKKVQPKVLSLLARESVEGIEKRPGRPLEIYNPVLGGRLTVRVTDRRSDALEVRGHLRDAARQIPGERDFRSPSVSPKLPEHFEHALDIVLRLTEDPAEVMNVRAHTKDHLLDPGVTVRTPRGKFIKLPKGATILDLAAHLHVNILARCTGGVTRVASNIPGTKVHRSSLLKDGHLIELAQTPSPKPRIAEPVWLLEAALDITRRRVKRLLSVGSPKNRARLGRKYLNDLAPILGLMDPDLGGDFSDEKGVNKLLLKLLGGDHYDELEDAQARLDLLRSTSAEQLEAAGVDWSRAHDVEGEVRTAERALRDRKTSLWQDVGSGDIDPVRLLAENIELGEGIVIRVDLPHKSGRLLDFLGQFVRPYINLSVPAAQETIVDPDSGDRVARNYLRMEPMTPNVPTYELLRCLVQLSKQFDVRVVSSHFVDLGVQHGLKMAEEAA